MKNPAIIPTCIKNQYTGLAGVRWYGAGKKTKYISAMPSVVVLSGDADVGCVELREALRALVVTEGGDELLLAH